MSNVMTVAQMQQVVDIAKADVEDYSRRGLCKQAKQAMIRLRMWERNITKQEAVR